MRNYCSTSSCRLFRRFLFLSIFVPVFFGCTNATPVVALLTSGLLNTEPKTPQVEITAPPENSFSQGSVTLTGSCTTGTAVLIGGADLASGSKTIDCTSGVFSQIVVLAGGDGSKLIEVSQTNSKGKSTKVTRTIVKDTVGPSMTLNQLPGQADPTALSPIYFELVFSEPVDASGFLSGSVINGGSATGTSWSLIDSGNHMNFTLVAAMASNGTVIPSFAAGVFKDLAGNSGTASTSTDNIVNYDTTLPSVVSVSSPDADGTYTLGASITISVKFSELVYVSGAPPSLTLETGATDTMASYSSGSGTDTLVFIYTVAATDFTTNLELANPSINGNGGAIKDSSNNQASLSAPYTGANSLSDGKSRKIVGTPASLSISDGPLYDFGSVFVGANAEHTFTLTNLASSVVPATGISGLASTTAYPFKDGSFPGNGGDCGSTLNPGATCTIVIQFSPKNIGSLSGVFSVSYNTGNGMVSTSRMLTGTGVVAPLTVDSPYPGNANWNDYVNFTDSSYKFYNQPSNTPCSSGRTEPIGQVGGCIHSGEIRAVTFPGMSSCLNLMATDSLGVFKWICDDSSSTAKFYSVGFLPGKGLRDLIQVTGGSGSWKLNKVQVRKSGALIGDSSSQAWWTNDVLEAPANDIFGTNAGVLSGVGKIYYIHTSRSAHILEFAADKIALVTLGSAVLSSNSGIISGGDGKCDPTNGTILGFATGNSALLCIGSKKHLWIEAALDGSGGDNWAGAGLLSYQMKYSRIHQTSLNHFDMNIGQAMLEMAASPTNLVTNLELASGSGGLRLRGPSTKNIFRNISVSTVRGTTAGKAAVQLESGSDQNYFYDVSVADVFNNSSQDAQGISIYSSQNAFQRVMISNISGNASLAAGIKIQGGNANILTQTGSFSSNNTGLLLKGGVNNIVSHFTAANHVWNGIYAEAGTTNSNNYFHSIVIANGGDKAIQAATSSGSGNIFQSIAIAHSTTNSIEDQNGSGWFDWASSFGFFSRSSATGDSCSSTVTSRCSVDIPHLNMGLDLSLAFAGKVLSDFKNTKEDVDGKSTYSNLTNLAHWLDFDFWLRGWGIAGSVFPDPDNRGFCGAGTCQLWDWRVKTGSGIHNRSGNGSNPNQTFMPGSACPNEVGGNRSASQSGMIFLLNAIEIDGDGIGNDNGLCESNETCIYAPNLGAYQGEGTVMDPCNFSNGAVTNVTMKAYSTTGL